MANDLDQTVSLRAGQTLGPLSFNVQAVDRYGVITVAVGAGEGGETGGGVTVLVEGNPQGTQWQQIAVLGFGVDATIESTSLLIGFRRYRVSASATHDATLHVVAART